VPYVYEWLNGPLYGRQESACEWSVTHGGRHKEIGFKELKNVGSIFVHSERELTVSTFVDDPLTKVGNRGDLEWYDAEVQKRFETRGREELQVGKPLSYLNMRMRTDKNGFLYIDNEKKIQEYLEAEGMQDCNPVSVPITKDLIKNIHEGDGKPLSDEDAKRFRRGGGVIGWLKESTHPPLTVLRSIMGSCNAEPVTGCMELLKHAQRYLQGVKAKCLVLNPDCNDGLEVWTDSDWAGMYSVMGDPRSRTGIYITNNKLTIYYKSCFQNCKGT